MAVSTGYGFDTATLVAFTPVPWPLSEAARHQCTDSSTSSAITMLQLGESQVGAWCARTSRRYRTRALKRASSFPGKTKKKKVTWLWSCEARPLHVLVARAAVVVPPRHDDGEGQGARRSLQQVVHVIHHPLHHFLDERRVRLPAT